MFLAGDIRANEQVGLTSVHTLFMREHNRLADLIKAVDPGLSDEDIYQKARKIVGAQMQIITYNEFLPALLGDAAAWEAMRLGEVPDAFHDDKECLDDSS